MDPHPRVLIGGIGNIFLGDDAFGVEVVRRLPRSRLPDGVDVVDFGIRGVDLAYALADGTYNAAILVDAAPRGGAPGSLYVIEVGADEETGLADAGAADLHSLTPAAVLAWVRRAGGTRTRLLIVGCEPASVEESMSLSAPVEASVDDAVRMVCRLASGFAERNDSPCA